MSKKTSDDDCDDLTIHFGTDTMDSVSIGDLTVDTIDIGGVTWDSSHYSWNAGDDITINTYTHIHDQTPTDPVEEAELKLQGICPACRNPITDHDWGCKHSAWNGFTVNSNWNFSTHTEPSITIGNRTLTEDKLAKIEKVIDMLDDDTLDKLDALIKNIKE